MREREQLIRRLGLSDGQLQDCRIDRLLRHKLALDEEIAELIAAGARDARIRKNAKLFGFSDEEIDGDKRISWLIKSVIEARTCLATLKPKPKKPTLREVNVEN